MFCTGNKLFGKYQNVSNKYFITYNVNTTVTSDINDSRVHCSMFKLTFIYFDLAETKTSISIICIIFCFSDFEQILWWVLGASQISITVKCNITFTISLHYHFANEGSFNSSAFTEKS